MRRELAINQASLPTGGHILVAVSGGADSVALLHGLHSVAKRNRWRLTVAHLEHGIRGQASLADAAFVRALARRLKISCIVGKVKVPALANKKGISLEMAARQARYAFLARTARRVSADVMATAHTADDQVETMLIKFLRGAGRGGLSGMEATASVSGIPIIRPLLHSTRAEIETYLRARKCPWREDETNTDRAFLRNRIRHELLPQLERDFNPGIRQTLLRTRDVLATEDEWMDAVARGIMAECLDEGDSRAVTLRSERLKGYPLAARRRVVRLWLFGQGVPELCLDFDAVSRVERLAGKTSGSGTVVLSAGWRVRRHYGCLTVSEDTRLADAVIRVPLKIPGITVIPEWGIVMTTTLGPGVEKERGGGPGIYPAKASLNAAIWAKRTMWIRGWQPGDKMIPFGMKGSRKVQDILGDAKIPRSERVKVPVVECNGEIVWIPGYRIAARWAIEKPGQMNVQATVAPLHNPLVRNRGRG
ncbi:MAG: tRNA lysidine(34) synthetase TilS [bacterium]